MLLYSMIAKYRKNVPQLENVFFMTDGGLETTLIFEKNIEIPYFCAFDLLRTDLGVILLKNYLKSYAQVAQKLKVPLILNTPTWRASRDWGEKLGYNAQDLAHANQESVRMIESLRAEMEKDGLPLVIGACIGPRGDGYLPNERLSVQDSKNYHCEQIESFVDTAADFITAMTLNEAREAIGIVEASIEANMPVVVSFTLETDGNLPSGQSLESAIEEVDEATGGKTLYFMINCVHPTHLKFSTTAGNKWVERIRGLRPNASQKSHAELNNSCHLDAGNPKELAEDYYQVKQDLLPYLTIMGGCCGTDHHHVETIVRRCAS